MNIFINTHKELMEGLIQKKEYSESKIEKLISSVKDIFVVEEVESTFKSRVSGYIKNLASIRPGRALLRKLAELKARINLLPSDVNEFDTATSPPSVKLASEEEEMRYATLWGDYATPPWVVFAHELIHALHFFSSSPIFNTDRRDNRDAIATMSNLEEQHTILGIVSPFFNKTEKLSESEILCENAFHLALGHPPRTEYDMPEDPPSTPLPPLEVIKTTYYEWLESEFSKILVIPKELKRRKSTIVSFIDQNPSAISSLSEKLKANEKLALLLVKSNPELLESHFSHLSSNKNFMLKAIKYNCYTALFLSEELLKDLPFLKEEVFPLFGTNKHGLGGKIRSRLMKKIEPSLRLQFQVM